MDALTRDPIVAKPRSRVRRWLVLVAGVLLTAGLAAGIWLWPVPPPKPADSRFGGPNQVIPVVAAAAEQRDMPVWLDGLGTVQAFQSVTVKPMVDGPLTGVLFQEGQRVRAGDVLATVDARIYQAALDNAVAKKALDEANLANARLDEARYRKLVATNFATQQQADTARAQVQQLEALVRQDQAQIDTAKTQLSYTTIVAPLDGRAGLRQVDKGNIVHASDPNGLLVIAQLQPVSVVFTLAQQALPAVAAAMKTGMPEVVAYPQGNATKPLDRGTLAVLDNQIDPATGTIKLKATFPNAQETLWPGGFVGVRLRVDTVKDATVVPPAAVQRGPRGSFVYTIDADNLAHRQPVTIGYEDEQGSIVTGGLKPGDKIVIDGASRLSDGGKVAIVVPVDSGKPRARPAAPGTRRQERGG